jgi:hypothetical protein
MAHDAQAHGEQRAGALLIERAECRLVSRGGAPQEIIERVVRPLQDLYGFVPCHPGSTLEPDS